MHLKHSLSRARFVRSATSDVSREGNSMPTWSMAAPAGGGAFFASIVEVVEAFTIVLAVATFRGWRPAAVGTAAALGSLAGGVVGVGPRPARAAVPLLA